MQFSDPLIRGSLVKRYKRFLTDVMLDDGSVVVAHCANSGSMLSVNTPGAEVWLSPARNPERKLRYTWEMIRIGETLVGINTALPNGLVADAIADGTITELAGYASIRREVKYGKNSRIDILLEGDGDAKCYVEVKNVTMRRDGATAAEFPDAVTTRGAKHLEELADMVAEGHRAVMVYLVQREDCDRVTIAGDIDPGYLEALKKAKKRGVEALAYRCKLSTTGIEVAQTLPIDL
ncbi:MAG: DNA/RNA nuclease SfsA [Rhodospirillales bacterium]|nr:DNA/RNA nuclease SfsA [Rhodospirillales bacterium]MCW8952180.1 DNA/RNA nuclease SfsA [Rhodospirillales bacterium]MCW9040142.1 DNA/RNA nuclease SfsA [Rhodospirillales bacterium]